MIKYLACPDVHFSDVWIDASKIILASILKSAVENKVDFVFFPGDLFDHAIYATDKGGINVLQGFIEELTNVCPAAAIYGTPSHDYKGCYGPLQRAGLQVLQPGKMYGFCRRVTKNVIREISVGTDADCILFGLPEITKEWYQAQYKSVKAEQVNAEATAYAHKIISDTYAPMRSAYHDIPAVLMLHGNVSDCSDRGAEKDIVMKSSDIILKTDVLAEANFTRVELGHIHDPWESKKCECGYSGFAGMDRSPWGHLDFVPSMTMVTIEGTQVIAKTRIPYGTPERRKIDKPLASYDPAIAYWLITKDTTAEDPEKHGANPWSKPAEFVIESKVERRVNTEMLETTTLAEKAKMFDKKITPAQLAKLALVEKENPTPPIIERDVKVTHATITGCKMTHGKTIDFDIDSLQYGLTQLVGDNGTCKSTTLGFCSPYPVFIGKDTDTGKSSAIKDFFNLPESGIQKTVYLNGVKHEHVITIKGAHTKNPKTECYLSIEGVPQLEKATFDQMFAKCEELYGKFTDYLITTFYVQPLQGSFDSGLMTAGLTTVRDIVQGIVGVSRDTEKRFCLDKVNELVSSISEERIRIASEKDLLRKPEEIDVEIESINAAANKTQESIETTEKVVCTAEASYTLAKAKYDLIENLKKQRDEIGGRIANCKESINRKTEEMSSLLESVESGKSTKEKLKQDEFVKQEYNKALEKKSEVDKRNSEKLIAQEKITADMSKIMSDVEAEKAHARDDFNKAHNEWKQRQYDKTTGEEKKKSLELRIKDINKPCPNCGFIDPDIKKTIDSIQQQINNIKIIEVGKEPEYKDPDLSSLRAEYIKLRNSQKQELEVFTLPSKGLNESEIERCKKEVDDIAKKQASAEAIKNDVLPNLEVQLDDCTKQYNSPRFDNIDEGEAKNMLDEAKNTLDEAKNTLDEAKNVVSKSNAKIEQLNEQKKEIQLKLLDISKREEVLKDSENDLADWKYLADMFGSTKLPAMELEARLDFIDERATKNAAGYRDGRYIYQTVTQKEGKTSAMVDKFDILVHDCETGEDKSLIKYSVGEKSFISDAYNKALVETRKLRTKTSYSPIISDEADSFIGVKDIADYYTMQKNYYKDLFKVLVVSHSQDVGNFIQNHINMGEIVK